MSSFSHHAFFFCTMWFYITSPFSLLPCTLRLSWMRLRKCPRTLPPQVVVHSWRWAPMENCVSFSRIWAWQLPNWFRISMDPPPLGRMPLSFMLSAPHPSRMIVSCFRTTRLNTSWRVNSTLMFIPLPIQQEKSVVKSCPFESSESVVRKC